MNWKPTNEPTNSIAPRSARTSEPVRRMPSRSSGAGERRSDGHERDEQDRAGADGRGREHAGDVGRAHDAEHEQQHPARQRQRTGDVDPPVDHRPAARPAARRRTAAASSSDAKHHRGEEHPPPADLGEQATGDHAEREAGRAGGAVDQQRAVAALALGERRGDDRQARRRQEAGGDARREAGEDEHPAVRTRTRRARRTPRTR